MIYVTKKVTKKVSVLKGVITEYVRYIRVSVNGNEVVVPKVIKAVTKYADGERGRKAFASNIRQYYGIVRQALLERSV